MEGSKGREKKDFESVWAERFADAESTPAPHVWKNISGELANQQVGTYKKRAFYYQLAAVASLFIALVLGALYFTTGPNEGINDQVALNKDVNEEKVKRQALTATETRTNESAIIDSNIPVTSANEDLELRDDKQKSGDTSPSQLSPEENKGTTMTNAILLADDDQKIEQNSALTANLDDAELAQVQQDDLFALSQLTARTSRVQWLVGAKAAPDRIYGVPIYGNARENQDKDEGQSLWAGLNLGSGNFDPNYGPPTGSVDEAALASERDFANGALDANTAGLPLREESSSGPAIAIGLDLGKSVGKRWVLQTGLTYGRYRVNSNTNLVFSSAEQKAVPLSFQNREALFSEEEITVTSESVDVDNNFQLLSIPVKAGFVLVDKKFNVLLNAGLASDIYLGNSLNASGDEIGSYDIDPGADSPYRRVHVNGLTSVQLGYQIQDNYYLSLEPSYRKAISDFAKNGNNFSSRPSSVGLVVGFRYLFR